jgi:tRNA-2-methylthio-N6-dimethylallyladenosine synthase
MIDKRVTKKRVFLRTFGCQMNVRDSEYVAGVLENNGFRIVDRSDKADVVLFNSCSVRKHAEDKLFTAISEVAELKKRRPRLVVGLIGCTAQLYKAQAIERSRLIDIVCGPGNESDLPALINDFLKNRCALIATDKPDAPRPELFPAYRANSFKAMVSISEGCDNFCSYCIVPYVRGRERSRDSADIVREIEDLAARGFKEIMLLGQNVNSYNSRKSEVGGRRSNNNGFVELLERLNTIDGIERIRFMTSHPKDASAELFRAMRDLDKVCEHLHLPLQSGSDRILKLMNRGYTAKKYLNDVELYRKYVPEGSLTTDIVVGFPTEGDEDFRKTYRLMERVGFDAAFTFKYSPRPPAKSTKLRDGVPPGVKTARIMEAVSLQCRTALKRNGPLAGKTVEVLVDGHSKKDPRALCGRTRTDKTVVFRGRDALIGKSVDVKVESVTSYALRGRMTG